MRGSVLLEEAVDDLFLACFSVRPQGHQLDELFTGDLADGCLVDQTGIHIIGDVSGVADTTPLSMMMPSHSE